MTPGGLRTRSRRGGYRDVRRVLLVGGLGEALELVDVAAVVRDDDAGALGGVMAGATADGDDAVALFLLVEGGGLHDVVVLGVGLHLVVEHDLDTLVLDLAGQFLDDARTAQAGGHQQSALEAEVLGFHTDDVVCAHTEQGAREGVELLDRKIPNLVQLNGHRTTPRGIGRVVHPVDPTVDPRGPRHNGFGSGPAVRNAETVRSGRPWPTCQQRRSRGVRTTRGTRRRTRRARRTPRRGRHP